MSKYELIPQQLLLEGIIEKHQIKRPSALKEEEILMAHDENYWEKLRSGNLSSSEIRKTGFPYSEDLIQREITIAGGTLECARYALKHNIALNIAGGTHHAFTNRGEGFCLLNDIAVAARVLLSEGLVRKVLVIDLDVHQGNGTAEIFRGDPKVFTFSMHGAKNYPLKKEISDLDIELPDGTEDKEYLELLRDNLLFAIENQDPDFAFFQSGVDVLRGDKLGRLALTFEGLRERDHIVFKSCAENDIPVVACMGGGYSPKISTIVNAHAQTFSTAREVFI